MSWLKSNIIQIIIILGSITFGYANFTKNTEVNARDIKEVRDEVRDYKKETNDKLDKAVKLLERIDERTKRL